MFSDQTMSQDATPAPQTGESRGHKRARSLGTESTKTIEGVINVFDRFETMITKESSAADSVELQVFLSQVRFLKGALENLLKEREKAKDQYEVKAVSFSSVDKSHLKEMGLDRIVVLEKKTFEDLLQHFHSEVVADEATLEVTIEFLGRQLVKVNSFLASKNETAARMFIDQVLIELAQYSLPQKRSPTGNMLACWTELNIANQERPVNIRYGRFMTMLTGIVDYALGYGEDHVPKGVQTIAALEKIGSQRDAFSLLEAKGTEAELWRYLAQAIAQSLALTDRQVTKEDGLARFASFALSNGLKWIFGVTKVNPVPNKECTDNTILVESVECRCSPMVAMTDVTDEVGRKEVFRSLLTWVQTPSQDLWEHVGGDPNKVETYVAGGELVYLE